MYFRLVLIGSMQCLFLVDCFEYIVIALIWKLLMCYEYNKNLLMVDETG